MGTIAGPSILKIFTIVFYAIILVGILAAVINGFIVWKSTGDWKPMVDSTLGQVVYWDGQIDIAMTQLTSPEIINSIPEGIRSDYQSAIAKQVLIYLALFIIVGVLLYKFGNWVAGRSQLDPTTDLMIVGLIILFFAFAELVYGFLMKKPNIIPYKGLINWIMHFDVWWKALSGVIATSTPTVAPQVAENITNTINITGGI